MLTERTDACAPGRSEGVHGLRNGLLAALDAADRALVIERAEWVELARGEVLSHPARSPAWTYFPCLGTVVSLLVMLADGRGVEAAAIGHEGVVGGAVASGTQPAMVSVIVRVGGDALRVPARIVEAAKDRSPGFRKLIGRHEDVLLAQSLQTVACNTFHSLEARFCRLLLMTGDRADASVLPLTQETLAEILGVQRTTICALERKLRARGLLRLTRGGVEIADRAAVEGASCECYFELERHRLSLLSLDGATHRLHGRGRKI